MNLAHLGESTMDFQLVMGLLSRKQEVLLYQVSQNDTDEFFRKFASVIHWRVMSTHKHFLESVDKFLAAMDGSYCSVGGVDTLSMAAASVNGFYILTLFSHANRPC